MNILRNLILFLILGFYSLTFANNKKNDYNDLLLYSEKVSKPIFLYFKNNSCGWCLRFERETLKNETVEQLLDKDFLFLEINTDTKTGKPIGEKYNIRGGPISVVINYDEIVINKKVGFMDSTSFLAFLNESLKNKTNLLAYNLQYKRGNREDEFIRNYCDKLFDADELTSKIVNEYLKQLDYEEYYEKENLQFLNKYAFAKNGDIIIDFDSEAMRFILDEWENVFDLNNNEQAKLIYLNILTDYLVYLRELNDLENFKKTVQKLNIFERDKHYIFNSIISRNSIVQILSEDEYYFIRFYRDNNYLKECDSVFNSYINNHWNDEKKLNNMAYDMANIYKNDLHILDKCLKCITRSVELEKNYFNMDTYAFILLKLGEYEESKEIAKEALEIAKKANFNSTKETYEILEEIEKKQKND